MSEPYKFNEYLDYLQYVAINRVLIYLIQNPEKGIIWWSKNPIEELPTCSSVLVVGNKTGIPVIEMTLGHNLTYTYPMSPTLRLELHQVLLLFNFYHIYITILS